MFYLADDQHIPLMPNSPYKLSQFWQELKRRRVIKVIAMYAATAFILLEVVDIITPALLLPSWTVTLVIVLLAIGFPITIILSWIFDVTPEGVKKTESLEKVTQQEPSPFPIKSKIKIGDGIIAVLIVIVVILFYPRLFNKDKFENIREEDGRISVAVMPFKNLTVDTLFNVWQEGVQNLLINKLSNSEELSVRQSQTMFDILESTGQTTFASMTPSIAGEIALKLETNTFILGSILKAGDKVRISAQLRDAKTQEIFRSYEVDGDTEDDLFEITDSLSNLLKNYLEIEVLKQDIAFDYSSWAFTSSSEAYRYFIEGLNSYFHEDYGMAVEIFNQAVRIDTSFLAGYSWLLESYGQHGWSNQDYSQIEVAKHVLEKLMKWDLEQLSRIQQLSFNMIISEYVDKNPHEYIKNCKLILEYDPQQRVFWNNLGRAYNSIYQFKNAIEAFEKAFAISEQWGITDDWSWMYLGLGFAYHYAGYHESENELYKSGLRHMSNQTSIIWMQAECALSRVDTTVADKYIAEYKSARINEGTSYGGAIEHRLGHMYDEAQFNEQSEAIWRQTIEKDPHDIYHKRCFAEFLIMKDINVEEGLELVNGILELYPDYYDILFFKGLALYKQGHLEEAYETLKAAWDKRFTYRHGHYLAIKEVEQALASQNN
jgi:tetratricopeptide (TPR) repeat protein